MATLRDFDYALGVTAKKGADACAQEGVLRVGRLAAKLTDEELVLLRMLWPTRPLRWQKLCADVLDQARRAEALVLLLDMVDRGGPGVTLAALESLSAFDPSVFSPQERIRILAAVKTTLGRPIGPLHQLLLKRFQANLLADVP